MGELNTNSVLVQQYLLSIPPSLLGPQPHFVRRKHVVSYSEQISHSCKFKFDIIFITNLNVIFIINNTRPKPAYGRQGLAGSWGQDTDKVSTFLVFLTSHFAPAALSSDLTNLGPLMTMKIHLETFKNHGNQPKTMKNHETTLKIMETKQKP